MAILQAVSLLTLVALAAGVCPEDFTPFGNNACYLPVAQKLPWLEAERLCNSFSSCSSGKVGHLASIHSELENSFVHQLYNTLFINIPEPFWIGYNDQRQQGQFEWSDGWTYPPSTLPFTRFIVQPTAFTPGDCVSLDGVQMGQPPRQGQPARVPGAWQVRDCTLPLAFVCIIEDAPALECPAPGVPPTRPI